MDIDDLQIFKELAKTKHFRKTSARLHMSTSTLTRIIQRLEEDLDCTLFERDKRHVDISSDGQHVLQFTQDILNRWEHLQETLNDPDRPLKGTLRLCCSVTASYGVLPHYIRHFKTHYPELAIQLETAAAEHIMDRISDDHADIGITAFPDDKPTHLAYKKLMDIPLTVITKKGRQVNWDTDTLLLPDSGVTRDKILTWFKRAKITPNNIQNQDSFESILSLTSAGYGIGIIPKIVSDESKLSRHISHHKTPKPMPALTVGLCTLKRKQTWPKIKAFWDACVA